MLSILQDQLEKKNISYTKLTGATKKREEVIEKFICCLIFNSGIPPWIIVNNGVCLCKIKPNAASLQAN
jgi:hypothetical protein